jgi:uncharacterized FlaG/YvyC family protein
MNTLNSLRKLREADFAQQQQPAQVQQPQVQQEQPAQNEEAPVTIKQLNASLEAVQKNLQKTIQDALGGKQPQQAAPNNGGNNTNEQ